MDTKKMKRSPLQSEDIESDSFIVNGHNSGKVLSLKDKNIRLQAIKTAASVLMSKSQKKFEVAKERYTYEAAVRQRTNPFSKDPFQNDLNPSNFDFSDEQLLTLATKIAMFIEGT